MKNTIRFVFLFLVLFFSIGLASCKDSGLTDQQLVDSVYDQLEVIFQSNNTLSTVTENVTLITQIDNVTISWTSSHPNVVSTTGVVTRQASNTTVTLTATITKNNVLRTKSFTIIVLATAANNQDVLSVTTAKNNLSITFAQGDSSNSVTRNVILPTSSQEVVITWSSSHPQIISTSGVVNRTNTNTLVTLTATLTKGVEVQTKTFELLVIRQQVSLEIETPTSHEDVQTQRDTLNLSYQQPSLTGIKLNTADKILFFNNLAGTTLVAQDSPISIQMNASFKMAQENKYNTHMFNTNTMISDYQFNMELFAEGVYGSTFNQSSLMGQIIFNGSIEVENIYQDNSYLSKHSLAIDSDIYLHQGSIYMEGFYKLFGNYVAESTQLKHRMDDYSLYFDQYMGLSDILIPEYPTIDDPDLNALLDLVQSLEIYKDGSHRYIIQFNNNDDIKAIIEELVYYEPDKEILTQLLNHTVSLTLVIENKTLTYIYAHIETPQVDVSVYQDIEISGQLSATIEIRFGQSMQLQMPNFSSFEEDGTIDFSPFNEALRRGDLIDVIINDGIPVYINLDDFNFNYMYIPVTYIYENGYLSSYIYIERDQVSFNTPKQTINVNGLDIEIEVTPRINKQDLKGVYRIIEQFPDTNYRYLFIVQVGYDYVGYLEISETNYTDSELIDRYNNLNIDEISYTNIYVYQNRLSLERSPYSTILIHKDILTGVEYIETDYFYYRENNVRFEKVQGQTEFASYPGIVDYYFEYLPNYYRYEQGLSQFDQTTLHLIYSDDTEKVIPFNELIIDSMYPRGNIFGSNAVYEMQFYMRYKNISIQFSLQIFTSNTMSFNGFYAYQRPYQIEIGYMIKVNPSTYIFNYYIYDGTKTIDELTIEDYVHPMYMNRYSVFFTENDILYEYYKLAYQLDQKDIYIYDFDETFLGYFKYLGDLPRYLVDFNYEITLDTSQVKTNYELGDIIDYSGILLTLTYDDGESFDITPYIRINQYQNHIIDNAGRIISFGEINFYFYISFFNRSFEANFIITVNDDKELHQSDDLVGFYYRVYANQDVIEILEFSPMNSAYRLKIYQLTFSSFGTEITIETIMNYVQNHYYYYQSSIYFAQNNIIHFRNAMLYGPNYHYSSQFEFSISNQVLTLSDSWTQLKYYYLGQVERYVYDKSYTIESETVETDRMFYLGDIITKEDFNFYAVFDDERILIPSAYMIMNSVMIVSTDPIEIYANIINGNGYYFMVTPSNDQNYLESEILEGLYYDALNDAVLAIGFDGEKHISLFRYNHQQNLIEVDAFIRYLLKLSWSNDFGVSRNYIWIEEQLSAYSFEGNVLTFEMYDQLFVFEYLSEAPRFLFDKNYELTYEIDNLMTEFKIGDVMRYQGFYGYIVYPDQDIYYIQPEWYEPVNYSFFNHSFWITPEFAGQSFDYSYYVHMEYDSSLDITKDMLGIYEILVGDYKAVIMIYKQSNQYIYKMSWITFDLNQTLGDLDELVPRLLNNPERTDYVFMNPEAITLKSYYYWSNSIVNIYSYNIVGNTIYLNDETAYTFNLLGPIPTVIDLYYNGYGEIKSELREGISLGDVVEKEDVRLYLQSTIDETQIEIPSSYYTWNSRLLISSYSYFQVKVFGFYTHVEITNMPDDYFDTEDYLGVYYHEMWENYYIYLLVTKYNEGYQFTYFQVYSETGLLTWLDLLNNFDFYQNFDVIIKGNQLITQFENGTISMDGSQLIVYLFGQTIIYQQHPDEYERYLVDRAYEVVLTNMDIYTYGVPFDWSNHDFIIRYEDGEDFVVEEHMIDFKQVYSSYDGYYIEVVIIGNYYWFVLYNQNL